MNLDAKKEARLQRNIARYLAFAILRGVPAGISIVLWVVFLQQRHGFSLTQVTLLDLPFWIGKFLFEIPTGLVADWYGRKWSLAISAILSSLTWAVFSAIHSFPLFLVMQLIGAFGATFSSGADDALLFETMQSLGREDQYARIAGRARAFETISAMLAGLAAGWIATTNIVLPIVIASVVYALTLIPILTMIETVAPRSSGAHDRYVHTVREAFSALRKYALLRWTAIYVIVLSCVGFYVTVFLPPHSLNLGLPIAALGPVMVAVQILGVAGSLSIGFVQKHISSRLLLLSIPFLLVPVFILMGVVRAAPVIVIIVIPSYLLAVAQPVIGQMVHGRISNSMRATFVSIQSLLATVFLIITEPGLGLLADRFGPQSAFLGMAVLLIVFCAPLIWQGRRLLAAGSTELTGA